MKAKFINEESSFERNLEPKRSMGIGQGKILDMISGIDAFSHFLYYAPYDFVEQAWGDSHLKKHLLEKLESHVNNEGAGYMNPNSLMKFIRDLDKGNQNILYKYIVENHTNKW